MAAPVLISAELVAHHEESVAGHCCRLAGALAGWGEAVHRSQAFRQTLLQMGARLQVRLVSHAEIV